MCVYYMCISLSCTFPKYMMSSQWMGGWGCPTQGRMWGAQDAPSIAGPQSRACHPLSCGGSHAQLDAVKFFILHQWPRMFTPLEPANATDALPAGLCHGSRPAPGGGCLSESCQRDPGSVLPQACALRRLAGSWVQRRPRPAQPLFPASDQVNLCALLHCIVSKT